MPIQVVITSILLIAAFFAASLTWESCTSKKTRSLDDKIEDTMEQHGSEEFFEDDMDDDTYESEDQGVTDFSDDELDNTDVEYGDTDDKASYNEPEEENINTYEETQPVRRPSQPGKYLIVAGNFLVENNANEMVGRLVNLGYNSAEVAVFDYSQYYTVVASRSDDYALAKSLSNELKSKGVDCYVHTKKN